MRPAWMPVAVALLVLAGGASQASATRVRAVDPAGEPLAVGVAGDGWFDVSDEAGAARCIVTGDHVPAIVPPGAADGAKIVLSRGAAMEGRVGLADGRPVPGVALQLAEHPELDACDVRTTSDEKGAYRLGGLPPGVAHVTVTAPDGFLAPDPERLVLVVAGATRRIDLRVLEAVRVTLRVLGPPPPPPAPTPAQGDAAPGEVPPVPLPVPLPGAVVRIQPDWLRFPMEPDLGEPAREIIDGFEGRTDAAGSLVLPALPRRAGWRITVASPGLAPASIRLDLRSGSPSPAPVITLVRGATLALRAVDAASKPLAGPRARLTSMDAADADLVGPPPVGETNGLVRVPDLPGGTWTVELSARGARPRLIRGVALHAGAVTDLGDVLLEPGAVVAGTVLAEGSPVGGAAVVLRTYAEGVPLKLDTETDAAGRFSFDGLAPQVRCDVEATAQGFTRGSRKNVEPGRDVEIELQRAGSLVVELGGPGLDDLAGAWISIGRDRTGWTSPEVEPAPDEPNALLARDLAPGTVTLVVRVPRFLVQRRAGVELVAGEQVRVRLDLERGRDVAGRVLDADTRAPIAGATILCSAQSVDARSQDDGTFMVVGVKSPIDLDVTHPSFLAARLTSVDLDTVSPAGLDVPLDRGGSVEGTVRGADGAFLAGARITEQDRDGGGKTAVSDSGGHYRLDGLMPGTLWLKKVNSAHSFDGLESASVEIVKGAVARLDFGGGARLAGTVTFRGEPVRGARLGMVEVLADNDESSHAPMQVTTLAATTGDDGTYAMTGVLPGQHGLTIRWQGRTFGRHVLIAAGVPETRLDIEVPDLHLAGRVVDASTGAGLESVHVSLSCGTPPPGAHMSMMEDRSGPDSWDDVLEVSTIPQPSDTTTDAGVFLLLVSSPKACKLGAWREGYEHWNSPEAFDIMASRDDVVIALKEKNSAGRVRVTLRDAATGEPVAGQLVATRSDASGKTTSTQVRGHATEMNLDAPPVGEHLRVIAWAAGRAPELRDGIVASPDGSDVDVELRVAPGGSLRLLVPEGSLAQEPVLGFTGDLHLVVASGFDLCLDDNLRMNITSRLIREIRPGEWLVEDLPAGALTVRLGEAPPHVVDVVAGQVVEVDLR